MARRPRGVRGQLADIRLRKDTTITEEAQRVLENKHQNLLLVKEQYSPGTLSSSLTSNLLKIIGLDFKSLSSSTIKASLHWRAVIQEHL